MSDTCNAHPRSDPHRLPQGGRLCTSQPRCLQTITVDVDPRVRVRVRVNTLRVRVWRGLAACSAPEGSPAGLEGLLRTHRRCEILSDRSDAAAIYNTLPARDMIHIEGFALDVSLAVLAVKW